VSAAVAYVDAALAVTRRDFDVFRSYRLRLPARLVRPFVAVALFYYISRLVTVEPFDRPDAYFAFVVVGLVIMEVLLSTVVTLPGRVRHELVAGTFERFVVSPFGAAAAVVAMAVFPLVLALVSGALTLAFAAGVFGMPLRWETVALGLPVALLGCVAFAPLALLATAMVIVFKQAEGGVGLLTIAIMFIGGFLFPVALLPAWIEWTSHVQPFTPTLELLRLVLVGTPMESSPWVALLKVAVAAVALLPISVWLLGLAVRKSQHQGTITEY
jgi:ABC-2 type transport system permease protein